MQFLPGQRYRTSLLFRDTTLIDGNGCFDRKGNLILPSHSKLTVVVDGRVLQSPLSYLADQATVDKYNRIWVITRSNELSVYRIGGSGDSPFLELLCRYPRLMPEVSPRSLAIDGEGRLWVGTRDHGLYCFFFDGLRLVSRRQISMADGLTENFVVCLLCDTDNCIWACTPTGLDKVRFNKDHFLIDDVTPCNDMYQRFYKILASARGVHWVTAREGFMKISPSTEEKGSYIPSVLFSKVLVGDKAIPDSAGLSLPYDRNTLSFYIDPDLCGRERTRYTYLLEGSREPAMKEQFLPFSRRSIL